MQFDSLTAVFSKFSSYTYHAYGTCYHRREPKGHWWKCKGKTLYFQFSFTPEHTFFKLSESNICKFQAHSWWLLSRSLTIYILLFNELSYRSLKSLRATKGNKWTVWLLFKRHDGADERGCLYCRRIKVMLNLYKLSLAWSKVQTAYIMQRSVGVLYYAPCIMHYTLWLYLSILSQ